MRNDSHPKGAQISASTPTLGDICATTFLFLTTFRSHSDRAAMGAAEAEAALQNVWRQEEVASEVDTKLYELYKKARYLLTVCADELMWNADWDQSSHWRSQESLQFGTTVGGEKFFTLMRDPSYADPQLKEIFFQCLALGFQGQHVGETSALREMRRTLRLGLEGIPRERSELMAPGAYEETLGEDFTSMPVASTFRLLIVLLGIVLTLALLARVAYSSSVRTLSDTAAGIAAKIDKLER